MLTTPNSKNQYKNKMRTKQELFKQLYQSWEVHKEALNKRLKPMYVRLVYHRLFNEKSFSELSIRFEIPTTSIKKQFDWALKQISERMDKDFAKEIEICHAYINAIEQRKQKNK